MRKIPSQNVVNEDLYLSNQLEKASQHKGLFKKLVSKSLFCERCVKLQNGDLNEVNLRHWQKELEKVDKKEIVRKIFKRINQEVLLLVVVDVNDIKGSFPTPDIISLINKKKVNFLDNLYHHNFIFSRI